MGISLGKILTRSFIKSLYKSPIRSPIMSSYRSPNKLFFVVDVDNTLFSRRHKVMEYMDHRSIEYVKDKIDVMGSKAPPYNIFNVKRGLASHHIKIDVMG